MRNCYLLLIILCVAFSTECVNAQGLYGGLDISYGIPAASDQYLQAKTVESTPPDQFVSIANINTSVGQGLGAHLLLGYNLNPTFGFEFDVSYFLGSPTRIEERTTPSAWLGNPPSGANSGTGIRYNEVSSNQIRVAPTAFSPSRRWC